MPGTQNTLWAEVDEQGRLVMPPEVAQQHGLKPGTRVRVESGRSDIRLHQPAAHLTRIYLEPTDRCNLHCVTCMRNIWDEKMGRMSSAVFEAVLSGLAALKEKPTVFFGGLGEPLFHPRIAEMVRKVKQLGAWVELITNGTLLTEAKARSLIDAGLDVLWVSIDGATPESYADVRLGAELPKVLENLARFKQLRRNDHHPHPEIGVAFVAMKRNIQDLPEVLRLAKRMGASRVSVSNVMPYDAVLQPEMLYTRTLRDITYLPSPWLPRLNLPKMDLNEQTREVFVDALTSGFSVTYAGQNLGGANDTCNFIESGSISIGWRGNASPCLSLLHSHTSYLHGKPRKVSRHVIGSVLEQSIEELWMQPEFVAYREKVQGFGFAPCTFCGGCDLSEANQSDCLGNEFPACGGCLWAQGVIQCP